MSFIFLGTFDTAGGGRDPPKYSKLPKEHEMNDDDYDDYDRSTVLANCFNNDCYTISQIYSCRLFIFRFGSS